MTIIEQLEALAGPNREAEEAIYQALGNCNHKRYECYRVQGDSGQTCLDCGKDLYGADKAPRYTASLDEAMTLVPEGWERFDVDATAPELGVDWVLHGPSNASVKGIGVTPAIALCIAALRARNLS